MKTKEKVNMDLTGWRKVVASENEHKEHKNQYSKVESIGSFPVDLDGTLCVEMTFF